MEYPDGYEEIGRSLVQPVAEGFKKISWAADLAKMLGWRLKDVRGWLKAYEEEHAEELARLKKASRKRAAKLDRLRKSSQDAVSGGPVESRRLQGD